jgi:hypothetical protein
MNNSIVYEAIMDSVWRSVRMSVRDSVWNSVRRYVRDSVEDYFKTKQ